MIGPDATPETLARLHAMDQARHDIIRAALLLAATCWPDTPEGDTTERVRDHEAAHDQLDEALHRYTQHA